VTRGAATTGRPGPERVNQARLITGRYRGNGRPAARFGSGLPLFRRTLRDTPARLGYWLVDLR